MHLMKCLVEFWQLLFFVVLFSELFCLFQKLFKYCPGDSISVICKNDETEISSLISRSENIYIFIYLHTYISIYMLL